MSSNPATVPMPPAPPVNTATTASPQTPAPPSPGGDDADPLETYSEFQTDVHYKMRICVPLMYSTTHDILQFRKDVQTVVQHPKSRRNLLHWDAGDGLSQFNPVLSKWIPVVEDGYDLFCINQVLQWIEDTTSSKVEGELGYKRKTQQQEKLQNMSLILMRNYDDFWGGATGGQYSDDLDEVKRRETLLNMKVTLQRRSSHILVYGPNVTIPTKLRDYVTAVDYNLPGRASLERTFGFVFGSVKRSKPDVEDPTPEQRDEIVKKMYGLTSAQCEEAVGQGAVRTGFNFNSPEFPRIVGRTRQKLIRDTGLVELIETKGTFDDNFAGYPHVKEMVARDIRALKDDARVDGVDKPSGLIAMGTEGTGKSALVKAIGAEFNMDVLWVRADRLMHAYVGESEKTLAKILKIPQQYQDAGCILFLDEAEKLLGGLAPGQDDTKHATGSRMFSILLTYLQERNYDPLDKAYIVATVNDGWLLPPALIRRGRFNSRTYLDIPKEEERKAIFNLHLAKRGKDPSAYEVDTYAKRTDRFVGAEIEYIVSEAIKNAFHIHGPGIPDLLVNQEITKQLDILKPTVDTSVSRYARQTQWAKDNGFMGPQEAPVVGSTEPECLNFDGENGNTPDLVKG